MNGDKETNLGYMKDTFFLNLLPCHKNQSWDRGGKQIYQIEKKGDITLKRVPVEWHYDITNYSVVSTQLPCSLLTADNLTIRGMY